MFSWINLEAGAPFWWISFFVILVLAYFTVSEQIVLNEREKKRDEELARRIAGQKEYGAEYGKKHGKKHGTEHEKECGKQ